MGAVWDISADVHGNIYVTDKTNSCIQVFSASGVFLHSFGNNKLKVPWGVCVSGQYVYVSYVSNDCVSVFTTAGVYVTSFGQFGSKEGEFSSPFDLCINKNGFFICL